MRTYLVLGSLLLAACAGDDARASSADRALGGGAPQGCIETSEPLDEQKAAAVGVDLPALRAAVEAEHSVPLVWTGGETSVFWLRTESARYAFVRSTRDPDFHANIVVQCQDHVRADATVMLGSGDHRLEAHIPTLRLRARDQVASATVVLEADALRGAYRAGEAAGECFLAAQISLSLSAQGLSGEITDQVASSPCDELDDPLIGIGARPAATFDGRGDPDCTAPRQLELFRTAQSVDCGTVAQMASDDDYQRARQCVLDALARGDAFHALKWEQGTDSVVATGFVSTGSGVTMIHYDGDPTGGGGAGASMSTQACSSLTNNDANPACADDYRYQLCLVCADAAPSQPLCRGPAQGRAVTLTP